MALDDITKSPAPYQTLVLPQDTQEEEEVVSLASGFDNEVDPFAIEQPVAPVAPVAPVEPVELDSSLYGEQARPFVDTVAMNERLAAEDPAAIMARINASLGYDLGSTDTIVPNLDPAKITAYAMDVQRPKLLQDINLSRDSFTDEEFTDNTKFWDIYTPKEAEFKQGQRDALTDLYSTDIEQFSKVYDNLDINSQLNFVEGQYSQGTIDKTTYLEQAAGLLYADDARRSAPGAEPSKNYFIKEDILYEVPSTFADDPSGFYAREVILFDDQKLSGTSNDSRLNEEQLFKRAIGQTNYDSADSESKWVAARDNILKPMARIGLAIATGSSSEQLISAIKLVSGETLHASDYASLALGGMEMANIIKAPVDAATAAQAGTDAMNAVNVAGTGNAIAAGNAAQAAASAGTGVLGLGYNASKALITGVVTGDPVEAIALAYGPAIVKKAVGKLGVGDALNTWASDNNINADDLNAGISKTIKSLAKGDDIEDALLKGVGKYITEGGTILPDAVEDALKTAGKQVADLVSPVTDVLSVLNKNLIKPVASEVGDVLSAVDTETRGLLSAVDDKVLQPLTRPVGDVLSTADTAAREGLSAFDDAVLNPVGDVVEDVGQAVGDVAEDVGQAVGDALSEAETAVRQIIGDIDLPDSDLPDIDLPDIDLPDIDLPDIDLPDIDLNIPQVTSAPSPTRTTGGLFDVSQFEHEEGISLVGNLLTGLTEQDAKKLSKKQYQEPKEEMVDILSDPFANIFNYKV